MDLPTQAMISILSYLLPGFIAAAVIFSLTPMPRPSPFERIVQALVLTIIVQAALIALRAALIWIGAHWRTFGTWSEDLRVVMSVVLAVVLGMLWARFLNNDAIHSVLRRTGFTRQTSSASEWYGVLSKNSRYVVLHLKGARRLYGWPEEWPSYADQGHWVITQSVWLDGEKETPATGVAKMLVPAGEVEMVEMMEHIPTSSEGAGNG